MCRLFVYLQPGSNLFAKRLKKNARAMNFGSGAPFFVNQPAPRSTPMKSVHKGQPAGLTLLYNLFGSLTRLNLIHYRFDWSPELIARRSLRCFLLKLSGFIDAISLERFLPGHRHRQHCRGRRYRASQGSGFRLRFARRARPAEFAPLLVLCGCLARAWRHRWR